MHFVASITKILFPGYFNLQTDFTALIIAVFRYFRHKNAPYRVVSKSSYFECLRYREHITNNPGGVFTR